MLAMVAFPAATAGMSCAQRLHTTKYLCAAAEKQKQVRPADICLLQTASVPIQSLCSAYEPHGNIEMHVCRVHEMTDERELQERDLACALPDLA